jgi:hypothetical protein
MLDLHGRPAWFGVWLEAWARREDTPYWLTYSKDALPSAEAARLLPQLNAIVGVSAHRDDSYLCIALFPPAEAGRAEVQETLASLICQAAGIVRYRD